MEPGEGWTTDRKPNLILRIRAWFALRAYWKAEEPYRRLTSQMEALEAEREKILKTVAADNRAGLLDEYAVKVGAAELMRINDRFAELGEPWEKAEAAMKTAWARTQRVLRDIGFRETPN